MYQLCDPGTSLPPGSVEEKSRCAEFPFSVNGKASHVSKSCGPEEGIGWLYSDADGSSRLSVQQQQQQQQQHKI